jgi:hypothetical protein
MILLPVFILAGTMGAGCDLKGFKAGSVEGLATGLTTLFSGAVGAADPADAFANGATEIFAGLVGGFFTGFWSDDIGEFEEFGSQK